MGAVQSVTGTAKPVNPRLALCICTMPGLAAMRML